MFNLKGKYLLLPLLTLILVALLPSSIHAAKIETGNYSLDKQSIVEDDLYVSGDNITISGVVDGDVIATGQNIIVDGTVTGDIYIFGNTVTVGGNVYGSTIVMGSTVSISGTLRENVYVLSMITDINANMGKDLTVATGTLNLSGTVTDDIRVATGQATSDATVGGDFLIGGDNYTVDENDVYGELITTPRTNDVFNSDDFKFTKSDLLGFNIGLTIVSFIGMYIVGAILIYSAPVKTLQIEKKIITSWEDLLKSYAIGLVVLFTLPLPIFLLLLTLVGAPLALLILGLLVFITIFGTIWAESAMGHKILQLTKHKENGRFLSLLIGRAISVIVRLIPLI
ncbi:hypothetical protein A2436_00460, partial [candidate division WS6 bacterium RIFOXYC1_FULL_33_9]